jgi:hypothetical protein
MWVNSLTYGSAGGGFYWDFTSGQVWTVEQGWHTYSPQSPSPTSTLWVNYLAYGSAGGGFYLDPLSGQVWTSERGWHAFSPGGTPPPPTPRSTPTSSAAFSFGAGKKLVGSEVPAGTYRTRAATSGCYWERLSGLGGTFSEIIANEFTDGFVVVTIAPTDVAFSSSRCGSFSQNLAAVTASPTAAFSTGTFIVGVDIAPGTWRSNGTASCYWERERSFTGSLGDIIANDFTTGPTIVSISATDKGFKTNAGCGTWTKQ